MTRLLSGHQAALLQQIADANSRGILPSRRQVAGEAPRYLRARYVEKIDVLIGLGLVENTSSSGKRCALAVTMAGRDELEA